MAQEACRTGTAHVYGMGTLTTLIKVFLHDIMVVIVVIGVIVRTSIRKVKDRVSYSMAKFHKN